MGGSWPVVFWVLYMCGSVAIHMVDIAELWWLGW